MSQPVKRGPGRPRKAAPNPAATVSANAEGKLVIEAVEGNPADVSEVVEEPAEKKRPHDPNDPRIGQEVHPTATHVGFDDGTQYLAAGGFITERVN